MVHVFKNWKLLFKNFCGNTCGWKSVWKYVKYCLKTENCCLEALTKHSLKHRAYEWMFFNYNLIRFVVLVLYIALKINCFSFLMRNRKLALQTKLNCKNKSGVTICATIRPCDKLWLVERCLHIYIIIYSPIEQIIT